jgi:hypothetical protein
MFSVLHNGITVGWEQAWSRDGAVQHTRDHYYETNWGKVQEVDLRLGN